MMLFETCPKCKVRFLTIGVYTCPNCGYNLKEPEETNEFEETKEPEEKPKKRRRGRPRKKKEEDK